MGYEHELVVKLSDKHQRSSTFWKGLFLYIFFPVAFPILVYQAIRKFRERFGFKQRLLEGKVVLISGASSGIGERLAHQFYKAGCRLILVSRKKDELERVKAELVRLETFGPVYVPAILILNLEDLESLPNKANSAVEIYGHIDILINNAGQSYRGTVLDTDINVDQKLMTVNYFGPLSFTRNIAQSMVQRKSGKIVFMSSIQGKIAIPYRSAYAAAKHAIQALADSLRAELHDSGIEVLVISPSYVNTNLSLNALTADGHAYGQTDTNTSNGVSPEFVAEKTLKAVLNNEKERLISSTQPRIAIFLRYWFPSLYFYLMSNRARKEKLC